MMNFRHLSLPEALFMASSLITFRFSSNLNSGKMSRSTSCSSSSILHHQFRLSIHHSTHWVNLIFDGGMEDRIFSYAFSSAIFRQMSSWLTSRCSTVLTANCISISPAFPAESGSNWAAMLDYASVVSSEIKYQELKDGNSMMLVKSRNSSTSCEIT